VNWLRFGDCNMTYFHNACSTRRRKNRIGLLLRDDGSWVEGEEEKKSFISNYFTQLFRSSQAAGAG
jgi:hypothetical protein